MNAAPRLLASALALAAALALSTPSSAQNNPDGSQPGAPSPEQEAAAQAAMDQLRDAWNRAAPVNGAVNNAVAGATGGPGMVSAGAGYLAQGLAALGFLNGGRTPPPPPAAGQPEQPLPPREVGGETPPSGPAGPSGPSNPEDSGPSGALPREQVGQNNAFDAYNTAADALAQSSQQRSSAFAGPGGGGAPPVTAAVPRNLNENENRVVQERGQPAPAAPFNPSRPAGDTVSDNVLAVAAAEADSSAKRGGAYGSGGADPAVLLAAAGGRRLNAYGQALDAERNMEQAADPAQPDDGMNAYADASFSGGRTDRAVIGVAGRIGMMSAFELVPQADPVCASRTRC